MVFNFVESAPHTANSVNSFLQCTASDFTCPNGAIRLAGGQSTNEGRVEICVDNQYGTICDDNWDDRDAAVVCAQMGFSRMSKRFKI